ncbi:hypothetical protein ACG33_11410 [Steroidobacter denitrificans]|uniref:2,3-dihydroxybenzoate-AMP ligase n=1 Tax=Steroidobacter denitrificans TaxID=465721 RepID=A0A127FBB3_STEDE|nr:class I adenylate-forming enzyme family protein [Steroidobacter denitrificans]AMN47696.1 hypothetical protein ACG33_11410 [Steroidobacter denitrificans]
MIFARAQDIERYSANGWWGRETLDQIFRENALHNPGGVAVVDAPNRATFAHGTQQRLSYAQLDEAVAAFAARLLTLGLRRDDVVASQLPNIVESIVVLLACARLGLVVSPLLVQFDLHELRDVLEQLRPKLFITVTGFKQRKLAQTAAIACVEYGCLLAVLDDGSTPSDWMNCRPGDKESVRRHGDDLEVEANDIFTVCWTSGTEGKPKGVMRSHNNWMWTGRAMLYGYGEALRKGDVILNASPLVNMAAIGGSFMSWLLCSGTLVLHHPLDMALALRQIRDEHVRVTFMPPAFFVSLLNDPEMLSCADLTCLRAMGTGSTSIPAWAIERMEREFGVEVVNFFGANEGTSLFSSSRQIIDPTQRASFFPRFGWPDYQWPTFPLAEQIESRLVDPETGVEIEKPGHPGELRMRSPGIFPGYFRDEQRTREAFDDQGFFRTGDLFEIAGEGEQRRYLRFVGRSKDIIVRGGLKIAPMELDEILSRHPLLKEAAAFGYADERLGEKVGIAAVPADGRQVTLQDIVTFLKEERLSVYKLPERLLLVEKLPRNALQKILRQQLSSLADERACRANQDRQQLSS